MAQENETEILLTINVGKAKEDLAALTKQIEELNNASEDNEDEIRALESQWDKLNDTIKKAEEIQTPLSVRLKDVQRQLQVLKLNGQENTETYRKLIEEAGQLKDAMGDTAAAINKTASDTANLDAALGALGAATGGFGIVTAGMSMFGVESEGAEKAQRKLLQAVTLVNSVQQLSNALNKDSALMVRLNAIAHNLFSKQMQATAAATNGATTAMKGFKTALVSTGVGALVVALGFLVQKLIEHNAAAEKAKSDEDELKSSMDKLKESTEFLADAYERLKKAKDDYAKSTFTAATDAEKLEILNKQIKEQETNLKGAQSQVEAYQKQVEKTGKALESARQQYQIFGGDEFKQAYEEAQAAWNNAKANLQGSQAQVLEFQKEIKDLEKQQSDITNNQAKKAKESATQNANAIKAEIQSRLDAARTKTQILKEEFDTYSKSADAEIDVAVKMRGKYGKALEEQFKIERELLEVQKKQSINDAKGNANAIKAAEQNYKNGTDAIQRATDKFRNNMDETASAVQAVFMKSDAEIQLYIDDIMKDIDEIDTRTKALNIENKMGGPRTLGTAFKANEDPEYLAEKKRIESQIAAYQELARTRVEMEEQANLAIEALRRQDEALEQNHINKSRQAWADAAVQITSYVASTLSSLADAQDEQSKKGFETAKKLQIASTIVNTIAAAWGAYRSLVEIPIVGPALAAAAMAATAATGAIQVSNIKKQKYGSDELPSSSAKSVSSTATGSSAVASTIISRNISPAAMGAGSNVQTVLVVDDVTYKQQQQENINRVSTI
jgi:chromosome segregation ATPase